MVVRVLVVDDQAIVREGISLLLDIQPDIQVVGEAEGGWRAVALTDELKPDVVVMDVRMPDLDGVAATTQIMASAATRHEAPPGILMLTTFREDDLIYSALRAGAAGFLLKDSQPELLVQAVHALAGGNAWIDPSVADRVIAAVRNASPAQINGDALLDLLTQREREVLILMAQGLSNRDICERWIVSEATVKTHVGRVLAKTESRDRASAVVFAYQHGLVAGAHLP